MDISFIVPVYNSEKYLSRCLDSLLSQKKVSFEIIVVNDSSPGPCDEIMQVYLSKHPHISYIKHDKNRSLMQARISGIEAARADYILHVDSDDWISSETGFLSLGAAKKHNADIVHFAMMHGPSAGRMKEHFSNRKYFLRGQEILEKFLKGELWWTQCGKLFKASLAKDALAKINIDKSLHINSLEDLALTFPMLLNASRYVCDPGFGVYYYFENTSSLTKQISHCEKRWAKLCCDIGAVRSLLLRYMSDIRFAKIEDVERLIQKNYDWALSETRNLPFAERISFLKVLNPYFNQKLVVGSLDSESFELLAHSLMEESARRPEKIHKVCILSDVLHSGGAERASLLLADLLLEKGYEVTAVTADQTSKPNYSHDPRLKIYSLALEKEERWVRLPQLIEEIGVDLCIHVSHYNERMMYDILSLRGKCYNVAVEHSMFFFPFYNHNLQLFQKRRCAYGFLDSLVCLSDVNKAWWEASTPVPVHVIPNPLTFSNAPAQVTTGNKKNILFVGRLCEMKGTLTALNVFRGVKDKSPDAQLILMGRFGSDVDEKEILSSLNKLGIAESVKILGHVDDVASVYADSRVHIMTSLLEGAPMVLKEAKSHGVPSVLLGLSYLEDVRPEDGAIVISKKDIDGMVNAIHHLLNDDVYWKSMSIAAKQSLQSFSNEQVLDKWESLFASVVSGKKADLHKNRMLELTLNETLDGLEYYSHIEKREYVEADIPYYATLIEMVVARVLPPDSERRRMVSRKLRWTVSFLLDLRRRFKAALMSIGF